MSNDTTSTCHKHVAPNPPPIFQDGNIHFQAHHIGFIVSGTFAIISTVVSGWLISKHLQWYTNKREQRYIVRLLFMVPLYALISCASFYFWNQSTPIVLVRDSYEAIVLTAFFYLLLMYLSGNEEEQRRIFLKKGLSKEADRVALHRGLPLQRWCFPLGLIKWKPSDGLYFLQIMKWAVLQYCVIRPTTTLAAVILDSFGLYCEISWNPRWGHIYIVTIISLSVTVAMYCLIQLYLVVAEELSPHKPLLKLFSVKAVVFLTFWQATFLSVLSMAGIIRGTKYMTAEDINIGINAVLETFEMMLFAFLHIRAFTYKPYKEIAINAANGRPLSRTPQLRSLANAMDFRETFREIWTGCIYLLDKMRGKEPKPDFGARRIAHYESAFGRPRPHQHGQSGGRNKDYDNGIQVPALPVKTSVEQDIEVELEGRRQWLGLTRNKNDRYYGLHPHREKSEGLEDQINHELERLGYPKVTIAEAPVQLLPSSPTRVSWWRTLYNRISHSGRDFDGELESFIHPSLLEGPSSQHKPRTNITGSDGIDRTLDDDPPPSSLRLPRSLPQNSHDYYRNHPDMLPLDSGRREVPDRNGVAFHSTETAAATVLSSWHRDARVNEWRGNGLMTTRPTDIYDFPPPVPPKGISFAAPDPVLNSDPPARKSTHRREPADKDPFGIVRMASRSPRIRPSLPTKTHAVLSFPDDQLYATLRP